MRSDKFILNMLKNPEKIKMKKGQIWLNEQTGFELLITDDLLVKDNLVRVAVVTRAKFVGDDKDLVLEPKNYKDIFFTTRTVLRITDCAVRTKALNYFLAELRDADLKKLEKVIKDRKFNFLPSQNKIIEKIIDKLAPLRQEAIDYYEKMSSDYTVKIIPFNSLNLSQLPPYQYLYAAGDSSMKKILDEFWKLEKQNKANAIELFKDDLLKVRISFVKDFPYLIFVSLKQELRITDIKFITESGKEILLEKELIIKKDKKFIPIGNSNITDEKLKLVFYVDNRELIIDLKQEEKEKKM